MVSTERASDDEVELSDDPVDEILRQWRRERPDLDPTPMAVFGRIARVLTKQRHGLGRLLEAHDLTLASFDVLANLRRTPAPHRKTPTELAASSMISTGGVTFRLDKLEAAGLVSRRASERDRRVVYAELTEEGTALIDEVIALHLERESRLLGAVDADDLTTLLRVLAVIEHALDAEQESTGPPMDDITTDGRS